MWHINVMFRVDLIKSSCCVCRVYKSVTSGRLNGIRFAFVVPCWLELEDLLIIYFPFHHFFWLVISSYKH